jgi:anaerobic magnesium-protoporphyrin IX monomethyl ester cyclase
MAKKFSLAPELYCKATDPRDNALMHIMREQDIAPLATDRRLPRVTMLVGHSPFTMPRGWEYYLTTPYEGPSYITTVLHNAGYPVRIVDVRYALDPVSKAVEEVLEGTDVLCLATWEDNFPFMRDVAARIKRAEPGMPIIAGGSLVTSSPHIFMEHTAIDIAVVSEGELTFLELMDSYAKGGWGKGDLARIRGIWYRGEGGQAVKNEPRGQMPTLDFLPRMRLDLWPQAKGPKGLQPQIITSFSRGCKMDCSFCFRTTPQVACKSPERFDREMDWLQSRYGINFMFFADLTFSAEAPQTRAICEVLEGRDVRFTCMTRCADVDRERLDAMKKAGCDVILFGVESLGASALKEARKPTTENISIRAMHRSMDAGIRFGTLFIVGLPGETAESLDYMCRFAEEYHHIVRVKYLSAMPGTSVYQNCLADGTIKDEVSHLEWLSTEQALHEDEFLNLAGLPEQVYRDAYKRIYDCYQPGPVMNFEHYPEHFAYFHPNPDDGHPNSVAYSWEGWRKDWSSAGPHLLPGSERYTLDKVGAPGMAAQGATLMDCGAKKMAARPE